MKEDRLTLDVSHLPAHVFGHRGLLWWGTLSVIAIEGMMFAMLIAAYFYLRGRAPDWPPNAAPPELRYGLINTLVLGASVLPNLWYKRAAEAEDLKKVRAGLLVGLLFALAFLVIRVFEFGALNCRWDTNAYGSVVWVLLGFHTAHLLTDFIDTAVIAALMFSDKIDGKRFVDAGENAFYWNFVVVAWLPVFAVIYLVPRWV